MSESVTGMAMLICPVCGCPASSSWTDSQGHRHYRHELSLTVVTPNECVAAKEEPSDPHPG